ncbi:MAG: UvrB/UvrC motif-containing protein, partial [Actinomycetota bacterium]
AEVRELREIRAQQPRYNRRSRDPATTVYLALTDEPFPRLSIVRSPRPAHAWTLGPLTSRTSAEHLTEAVAEAVGLRTCTPRLRLAQDHPACVLKDLGRCGAPCDGSQSRDGYAEVVTAALAMLDDPGDLLDGLRRRMDELARDGRFERAAEVRTRLHAVARALLGLRRRTMLAGVERLVAARPRPTGTEVVVVRRGRLDASAVLSDGQPDLPSDLELPARSFDPLGAHDPLAVAELLTVPGPARPPHPQHTEELGLVLAWLHRPDVRALAVDGRLASPVPAGAALAATAAEAREVERHRRRDRQALAGDKVRRQTE